MKIKSSIMILGKIIIIGLLVFYIPRHDETLVKVYEAQKVVSPQNTSLVAQIATNKKSIHLYNTHQGEEYNGFNVRLASQYLNDCLIHLGYHCDVENNDFENYKNIHHIPYNQSYIVSKMFLENTLKNHGGYDLIIDFHRDSLPKRASTLTINEKSYAKVMFVIGKSSGKLDAVTAMSNEISHYANSIVSGISKGLYFKKNHYNQGVSDHITLIEFGGQGNTKEEIKNTVEVIAQAIKMYLK